MPRRCESLLLIGLLRLLPLEHWWTVSALS